MAAAFGEVARMRRRRIYFDMSVDKVDIQGNAILSIHFENNGGSLRCFRLGDNFHE